MNRLMRLIFLDFKLLAKQKTFYFKLLLFPVLLILILGTVFGRSNARVKPFTVAFYDGDAAMGDASFGYVLKNSVLEHGSLSSLIRMIEVSGEQEGKALVKINKAAIFVSVPDGFSNAVRKGATARIGLVASADKGIERSIVKTALEKFSTNVNVAVAEQNELMQEAKAGGGKISEDRLGQVQRSWNGEKTPPHVQRVPVQERAVPIRALHYYSIAMVVMFSIVTAFVLVHSIVDDKLHHTLSRIKSTPTLSIQYIFGKLLGIIFAIVMQMAIVIAFTGIFYGMHWGNLFSVLLVTVGYASAIGSIVLLWGFLANDHVAVSSLASPVLYLFSFLGGSFVSVGSLPEGLKTVQQILPNGIAINAYVSLSQNGTLGDIRANLLELLGIALAFTVLTLFAFNGRGWGHAVFPHGRLSTKAES